MNPPSGARARSRQQGGAILIFAYLWVVVTFSLGTLTLLGPVRWITTALRARDVGDGLERIFVGFIIVLLVVISAWLALYLGRVSRTGRTPVSRVAAPVGATVAAAAAVWLWLTPTLIAGSVVDESSREVVHGAQAEFVFGPYPNRDALLRLQKQGFNGVISLLHVAVVPFEPKLLRDERANALEVGMRLIHAPMLPWVASNDASLDVIRSFASDSTGRYYVHCYLGRDRVNVVRRLISRSAELAAAGRDPAAGSLFSGKMAAWAGGETYELEDELYLTPYPSDAETRTYLASGAARHLVMMLDSTIAAERQLLDRARSALTAAGVSFTVWPIREGREDWNTALALAKAVQGLPRPMVVHAVSSNPRESHDVRMFLIAMKSRRPSDSESGRIIINILKSAGVDPVTARVLELPKGR